MKITHSLLSIALCFEYVSRTPWETHLAEKRKKLINKMGIFYSRYKKANSTTIYIK